jgi:tetratricopeptide (TPR) repeat protein
MSRDDWYRRTAWSARDREEFNARLKRSRGDSNKAQYLRIQAFHLAQVGLHTAAIELVDRLLAEFPVEFELASAHEQKAESLAKLCRTAEAIEEYRASLQSERKHPGIRTSAWLGFAWLVADERLTDLYDEVLGVLDEFYRQHSPLTFPVDAYRFWAVKSVIADHKGDRAGAEEFAKRALAEAARDHSGYGYHPTLGLIHSQPKKMEATLRELAGR